MNLTTSTPKLDESVDVARALLLSDRLALLGAMELNVSVVVEKLRDFVKREESGVGLCLKVYVYG